jgi:replicative DNA helicase Mcm
MPKTYTEQQLVSLWEDFFLHSKKAKGQVTQIADVWPDKRSVIVLYKDIQKHDTDLAIYLLENPMMCIKMAERAIQNVLPPDRKVPIHFRTSDLPKDKGLAKIDVRDLRAKHVGNLLAIEGLIRRVTEVRPKVLKAAFQCERCGTIQYVPQDDVYLKEPLACDQEAGGCGSPAGRTRFKLLAEGVNDRGIVESPEGETKRVDNPHSLSEFIDTQKLELQESPEGLRGGEQPKRLEVYCEDDMTGIVAPGDRVVLNGILRSKQKGRFSNRSTFFEIFLDVISIDHLDKDFSDVDISKDDEKAIKKLSREKDLRKKIIGAIAPSIFGMETEKEAIALQLFGGVPKIMNDKNRIRGDIHILLVGDPGVAKSQLLSYVAKLAPRGIYASGKSASAAGLTAAAVRSEEFGEGRWTLEAGALVLADMGIVCIDELDKMEDKDRDSMHTAMEQQQISVAKAGITATLQTRCAILAAANPNLGRFDTFKSLPEQIDLDPPLLTRFDVIFTITDKIDEATDRALADHILKIHFAGEANQYRMATETTKTFEDEDKVVEEKKPPIEVDFLRKYIAYAKRHCFPVMTPEAMKLINEYYVSMRRRSEHGAVAMTPRNIEAMIRLSEAHAKMNLENRVEVEDAEVAIRIVKYYLETASKGEDGTIDTDIISTGLGSSQRDRIWTIIDIISNIQGTDGASVDDIMRLAEERGMPISKVTEDLERLKRDGRIYERFEGRYRLA